MSTKNSEYLYRITNIRYILQSIREKKFVFRRMDTWDDKKEMITDYKIYRIDGIEAIDIYRDQIYATSWTDNEKECVAMWQLYSKDFLGVRIKVKLELLKKLMNNKQNEYTKQLCTESVDVSSSYSFNANALCRTICKEKKEIDDSVENPSSSNYDEKCWDIPFGIHKVKYLPESELKELQNTNLIVNPRMINYSAFSKLEAYSFEKETRAIIHCSHVYQSTLEGDRKSIEIDIEPSDFYEEFLFDSRLSDCEYEFYRRGLNEFYGIELSKIKKSTVFDQPEIIRVKARV